MLAFVTNCRELNLREQPDNTSKIVAVLNVADKVMVDLDDSTGSYYKVCTKSGVKGYCKKNYLTDRTGNLAKAYTGGGDSDFKVFVERTATEISLPESVTSIGDYAMYNNKTLERIAMPGVTSIGSHAFECCYNLAPTSLPGGLTSIGERAFYACGSLALTSLPENLTSIGKSAFYRCINLALTSLPEGVTTIEESAFEECSSLALTSLPASLTSIDDDAFYYCHNLALTSLPEGLTSIGEYAFRDTGVVEISLPASLTSIGNYAFYECSKLATVTFKGTPTNIPAGLFYNVTSITTINVPWAEGAVANAPWGATNATINYDYTGE